MNEELLLENHSYDLMQIVPFEALAILFVWTVAFLAVARINDFLNLNDKPLFKRIKW